MKLVITTVVTLTINDNIKFLENMRQRFKITIYWNKYRSEIAIQRKNNNLDYLIDPSFRNINRTFVDSFKNGNSDTMRDSFNKYYMPLVEIKDFNALIVNKTFFYQPVNDKHDGMMEFIAEKQPKTILNFSLDSLIATEQYK